VKGVLKKQLEELRIQKESQKKEEN